MASHWMRRAVLALASTSALLLAACGSGTIESQFQPTRLVVFGDGFSDMGQAGARYTVNDSLTNMWPQQTALDFGLTVTAAVSGGTNYATRNARISLKPDAVGNSATPTMNDQVNTFLASNAFSSNDLVVVAGGISDIIAETAQLNAGAQTHDQMIADVKQAGRDLGALVRRVVESGAVHVVVMGPYDLGKSPWATSTSQTTLLSEATTAFNTALLVSIVDLGTNVLYIDSALLFNLMTSAPSVYGMSNAIDPVCNSVDPGVGIGIGTGQVNSALCTVSTVVNATYTLYVFADKVYPAPTAHIKFGDYAFQRVKSRW